MYVIQVEVTQYGTIAICATDKGEVRLWDVAMQQLCVILTQDHHRCFCDFNNV
jgi:hypothetical protein